MMAGITRSSSLDMEILVHISAPTSRKDDQHYRALAQAYEGFDESARIVSASFGEDGARVIKREHSDHPRARDAAAESSAGARGGQRAASSQTRKDNFASTHGADSRFSHAQVGKRVSAVANLLKTRPEPKTPQTFAEAPDFGSLGTGSAGLSEQPSIDGRAWRREERGKGRSGNSQDLETSTQPEDYIEDTQLALSRLEDPVDVSEFGGWPLSSPLQERSSKRFRVSGEVESRLAPKAAHERAADEGHGNSRGAKITSSPGATKSDKNQHSVTAEPTATHNSQTRHNGRHERIRQLSRDPSLESSSNTAPGHQKTIQTESRQSSNPEGRTCQSSKDARFSPTISQPPRPSLDSQMPSNYGESSSGSQHGHSDDSRRNSQSTSQGSFIARYSGGAHVPAHRAPESQDTFTGTDAGRKPAEQASTTEDAIHSKDDLEHLRLYASEPPISTAEHAQETTTPLKQPTAPRPEQEENPNTPTPTPTPTPFAALPLEIHAPPPPTQNRLHFSEHTSILDSYTRGLPHPLAHFWRPTFQARAVAATDRGRWVFATGSWPRAAQHEFWTRMADLSARAAFGASVWLQRNAHPEPRLQGYLTDGRDDDGLGEVCVFCWGQVAWHVAAMLYVESGRFVKGSGARYVVGPAEGEDEDELVVEML